MYKILLIEDDEITAEIYKSKINSEGYAVEVAHDGESGYDKLESFQPDLLVIDLMLPKMSGLELLGLIRENQVFRQLPIIAFSGSDSDEILEQARRAGADLVLSKGEFSPSQVIARITELLSKGAFSKKSNDYVTQTLSEWKTPVGRMLVVDDDPIVLELVTDVLTGEGYSVVAASDGREAYKILQNDNNFAACIFDVNLPFIEGLDIIRHMKTEKRLMRLPVLIMTSDQSLKVHADSHSAGAEMFIPKPFSRATLKAMVQTIVKR